MLNIQKNTTEVKGYKWLVLAVMSAVFASLTAILGKVGIEGIDSTLGTAIRTVVVLIMAWMIVFVTGKKNTLKHIDRHSMLFLILSGISTGASWLCYYRALKTGQAGVVVPIEYNCYDCFFLYRIKGKAQCKILVGSYFDNSRYFVAFGIVLELNGQKIKPYNADIILQKGFVRAYEILYRYRGYICS